MNTTRSNKRRLGMAAIALFAFLLALAGGPTQVQGQKSSQTQVSQSQPDVSLGSGFTYQGQLKDGGNPANGQYDFQFKLFDAESGGTQVGSTITRLNQSVSGGLFTLQLDFGGFAYQGQGRWLEIAVRLAGGPTYTTLSPRQSISAAPYAASLISVSVITTTSSMELFSAYNSGLGGGLRGEASSGSGVIGSSNSGRGVSAYSTAGEGVFAFSGSGRGVYGGSTTGEGIVGQSNSLYGVSGYSNSNWGAKGDGASGVWGVARATNGTGVSGNAIGGVGVTGASNTGDGVSGNTTGGGTVAGVKGTSTGANGTGLWGVADNGTSAYGVWGQSVNGWGVYGVSTSNWGVKGRGTSGVWGEATASNGTGVSGTTTGGNGVYGSATTGWAGYFQGNVNVTGSCCEAAVGTFKIDHPLNPEDKYLTYGAVGSPDMLNIYRGTVTLNAKGEAMVIMPDYFDSLNRDFDYQLTPIGAPGPNLYIAEEIASNQFKIAGGKPGSKVSWQVAGSRHDPYALAHPLQVEVEKTADEQGKYLHPTEYGQPESKGIGYDENPALHSHSDK